MAKEPKTTTATGAVRIKMLVGMASMSNDMNEGDTPTVSAAQAERLIEKGFAERYTGGRQAKTAASEGDAE